MHNSETTSKKYQIIKQEIKSWILSGKLKENEQLKTEFELAQSFNLSRNTVRQAIGELVNEGCLYRVQGRGTFVSNWNKQSPIDTRNIGLITTHLFSFIFPNIVQGAESVLRPKEYGLLISSADNDVEKERACLESYLMKPIQGLIVEPTLSALPNPNLDYYVTLEERGIPFVMTNASYPQINAPTLMLDDEKGAYLAVDHLVGLGHRKIAGLFNMDVLQGARRMRGFSSAMKACGLQVKNQLLGTYNIHNREEKVPQLFRAMFDLPVHDRPTAIVCFNDELAVSLLDTIREMGLGIPKDLSIVGFDDSPMATATEVKLTSVAHPKEEMGRCAAEMLLEMIEKNVSRPDDVIFEPRLIIRNSTAMLEN